jgi:hypothetical protein
MSQIGLGLSERIWIIMVAGTVIDTIVVIELIPWAVLYYI